MRRPGHWGLQCPPSGTPAEYPGLFYAWAPNTIGSLMSNQAASNDCGSGELATAVTAFGALPYPNSTLISASSPRLRQGFTALLWFIPRTGIYNQYGNSGCWLSCRWRDGYNNKRSAAFLCRDNTWSSVEGCATPLYVTRATLTLPGPAVNTLSLSAMRVAPTNTTTLDFSWWFNGVMGTYLLSEPSQPKPTFEFTPFCNVDNYPMQKLYGNVLCVALIERYLSDDELTTLWPTPYAIYPRETKRKIFTQIQTSSEIPMYLFQRGIYKPTDSNIRRF